MLVKTSSASTSEDEEAPFPGFLKDFEFASYFHPELADNVGSFRSIADDDDDHGSGGRRSLVDISAKIDEFSFPEFLDAYKGFANFLTNFRSDAKIENSRDLEEPQSPPPQSVRTVDNEDEEDGFAYYSQYQDTWSTSNPNNDDVLNPSYRDTTIPTTPTTTITSIINPFLRRTTNPPIFINKKNNAKCLVAKTDPIHFKKNYNRYQKPISIQQDRPPRQRSHRPTKLYHYRRIYIPVRTDIFEALIRRGDIKRVNF